MRKISIKVILLLSLVINLNAGYIGKGGLYDFKFYFKSEKDGGSVYRIYCNQKNGMFSVSKNRVFKNLNNKWYDMLMDTPKYMGRGYDGLDVNQFGEKVCR